MKKTDCALILGSYVNGYSIVRELYEKKVKNIVLFDSTRNIASYSNKITRHVSIEDTPESLLNALDKLHEEYEKIIVFPTSDLHLENLHKIHKAVEGYCFLPFNSENLIECSDKYYQYSWCEKLGVPYPKTVRIESVKDIDKILSIQFPVLLKPVRREDLKIDVFRNLQLKDREEFEKNKRKVEGFIRKGIPFITSEIIPGDGSNIYAYVGYRNKQGVIVNEWTGKKLSQFPNDFGVFASASNQAPDTVYHQGRTLLNGMNLMGIAEPEFKYDYRDGKYKLMEINLRSMMWHRVGNLSGVNVQYSQYLDALGKTADKQSQIKDKDIHLFYFKHELFNVLFRRKYAGIFYKNLFKSDKTHFAVFCPDDLRPWIVDTKNAILRVIRRDFKEYT